MTRAPGPERGRLSRAGSWLRRQAIRLLLFGLVAVGGGGLATAADRPPTDSQRPELSWRAEQHVRPWVDAIAAQLEAVDGELGTLSESGREALVRLPALDVPAAQAALDRGDAVVTRLEGAVAYLRQLRGEQQRAVPDGRLRDSTRALLREVDGAAAATDGIASAWAALAADGRRVSRLLDALARHDELVFEATAQARADDLGAALELLDDAALALTEARGLRDEMAAGADVATLDELLRRYAAYDAALVALYDEIERNGGGSERVRELLAAVELAQSELPETNDALSVAVGEAAGPALAEGLVEIERVRGAVSDALELLP